MFHSIIKKILLITAIASLVACQKPQSANQIKVGTITGPETKLMEVAKQVAADRYGLEIKIVEFNDYIIPNVALNDGSIDANAFQHQPYLNATMKTKHYKLASVAKTFIYPIGIYSSKIKELKSLPAQALIAIPNDPSNEARALLLLQQAGLIKLKNESQTNATPADITDNTKQLKFKELDAAELPRVLPDVDAAVINSNFAVAGGLTPSKDALYLETKDSPYANIIVTREDNRNAPNIIKLISAYQSPEVSAAAKTIFHGEAIQAW